MYLYIKISSTKAYMSHAPIVVIHCKLTDVILNEDWNNRALTVNDGDNSVEELSEIFDTTTTTNNDTFDGFVEFFKTIQMSKDSTYEVDWLHDDIDLTPPLYEEYETILLDYDLLRFINKFNIKKIFIKEKSVNFLQVYLAKTFSSVKHLLQIEI